MTFWPLCDFSRDSRLTSRPFEVVGLESAIKTPRFYDSETIANKCQQSGVGGQKGAKIQNKIMPREFDGKWSYVIKIGNILPSADFFLFEGILASGMEDFHVSLFK